MLFKKLYYYYHHYKMWNYIVGQLKAHPQSSLPDLMCTYLHKIHYDRKHLNNSCCYLCSYVNLVSTSYEKGCVYCPLWKKYRETCYDKDSMYRRVAIRSSNKIPLEERIAAAEKIRDCVLFWKK